ncbi:MAG: TolC family protein [Armatimonadetes bacterium]|nr:TolC family protein [Armatimonadota bacterium]
MVRWFLILIAFIFTSATIAQDKLSLKECIELAIKTHPLIRLSYRQLDAALAKSEQAKAQWKPELTFNGYQRRQGPTVSFTIPNPVTGTPTSIDIVKPDISTLTAEFRQNLFTFGRKTSSVQGAEYQVNAASAMVQATQSQLILRVTESYADVLAAQAMEEVAKQAVERVKVVLKVAKAKYEAGVAPKFDVLRAEAELAAAEEQLLMAQNGVALAKASINQLLGRPTDAPIELVPLPESFFEFGTEPLKSEFFIKQALTNRPEMKSLEWQVKSADEFVKLAKADKNPFVLLTSNYVRQTRTGFSGDYQWGINLVVQFPIFDSGRRESIVKEREANLEQILAQKEQMERQIALEVEQALKNFQVSLQRLKTARAALASAEEAFRLAQVRYEGGVGTLVEVWDAQVALTRARANEVQSLYDAHKAFARLIYSTGLTEAEVKNLLKNLIVSNPANNGGERKNEGAS